jgi:hypothetical protein
MIIISTLATGTTNADGDGWDRLTAALEEALS